MISRQSSRSFSSRLTILTGGMRSPSWKTSVASAAKEPTALPPISARWPTLATKPNSSPSWKTPPHHAVLGDVRAASIRVVVQDDVAGLERVDAELLERPADDEEARGDLRRTELGLADHVAAPVEEDAREVQPLVEDRREGRARHRHAHLAADVHDAFPRTVSVTGSIPSTCHLQDSVLAGATASNRAGQRPSSPLNSTIAGPGSVSSGRERSHDGRCRHGTNPHDGEVHLTTRRLALAGVRHTGQAGVVRCHSPVAITASRTSSMGMPSRR